MVSLLLTWLAQSLYYSYAEAIIARLVAGLLGGGFYSCVVLFIAETADDTQVFQKLHGIKIASLKMHTEINFFQYSRSFRQYSTVGTERRTFNELFDLCNP